MQQVRPEAPLFPFVSSALSFCLCCMQTWSGVCSRTNFAVVCFRAQKKPAVAHALQVPILSLGLCPKEFVRCVVLEITEQLLLQQNQQQQPGCQQQSQLSQQLPQQQQCRCQQLLCSELYLCKMRKILLRGLRMQIPTFSFYFYFLMLNNQLLLKNGAKLRTFQIRCSRKRLFFSFWCVFFCFFV